VHPKSCVTLEMNAKNKTEIFILILQIYINPVKRFSAFVTFVTKKPLIRQHFKGVWEELLLI
jgi:hypothetical protein